MRRLLCVLAVLGCTTVPGLAQFPWNSLLFLRPGGKIDPSLVTELSGLVQSLRYDGVFWALGDSGNRPTVVPVQADGKLSPFWPGPVLIEGVRNRDWEDIALDEKGHLIIGDLGNNSGRSKQLMLHFVNEPKPGTTTAKPRRSVRVHYEDQKGPAEDYDCEALFAAGGQVYALTKQRGDQRTRLYRLAGQSTSKSNPLLLVDSFDIGGLVTAADVSPDGKSVAVLTYTALWVFDYDAKTGNIFRGRIRRAPVFAWQAEAVAFDGNDHVLIGNETGQLFRLPLSDLTVVNP